MKTVAKNFYTIVGIVVMTAVSVFAEWTGLSSKPTSTKTIDGKKFYVISSSDELAWFAKEVNDGNTEINAVLGNDIVFGTDSLSGCKKKWTPIGENSSVMFEGVFDGADYTIYGLLINGGGIAGLFGFVGEEGVVKNLEIIADTINGSGDISSDSAFVGSIAGINYGLIRNIKSDAYVRGVSYYTQVESDDYTSSYSGGIVGYNLGEIFDCENLGSVYSRAMVAMNKTVQAFSGGISAYNKGVVNNCINRGNISGSSSVETSYTENYLYENSFFGGIVAYNAGTISHSKNFGVVSSYVYKTGKLYHGGIAGYNNGRIEICENNGRISSRGFAKGNGYLGGIAGVTRRETSRISNCKNTGNVIVKTDFSSDNGQCLTIAGGITTSGNMDDITIAVSKSIAVMDSVSNYTYLCAYGISDYSYESGYVDTTNLKTSVLDAKSNHSSFMKMESFAWFLNNKVDGNSGIWSRDDSYPIFADSSHLAIRRIIFAGIDTTYTNYKGLTKFPKVPATPSDDEIFVGWYTEEMQRVDSNTIFRNDETVSARFEIKEDVWFSIRFFNADSTLLDSLYLQKWSLPSFTEQPSLKPTDTKTFKFKGWDESIDVVQESRDYVAKYDTLERLYTIRFVDYNDSVISKEQYVYKAYPKIPLDGERKANQKYNYAFKGWSPSVDSVKSDTDYFAMYDSVLNKYLIRYKVGNQVMQSDSLEYGEMPSYKLEKPTKKESALYTYEFIGWLPKEDSVKKSIIYIAIFDSAKTQSLGDHSLDEYNLKIRIADLQIQISEVKIGLPYYIFDVQGHLVVSGITSRETVAVKVKNKGPFVVVVNGLSRVVLVK